MERAESQFRHSIGMGDLPDSTTALAPEIDHIFKTSLYSFQVDAWLEYFRRDALLVVDFNVLRKDPLQVLNAICAHLDLPSHDFNVADMFNDSATVFRTPLSVLRMARSAFGRRLSRLVSDEQRDRLRSLLAVRRARPVAQIPDDARQAWQAALSDDANRFRMLTGLDFEDWQV